MSYLKTVIEIQNHKFNTLVKKIGLSFQVLLKMVQIRHSEIDLEFLRVNLVSLS